MTITSCPVGSQIVYYFGFALRDLTALEQERLEEGLGLPQGVGTDPFAVTCETEAPGDTKPTVLSGVIKDGVGAYHVVVPASVEGPYRFRGVGKTSGGQPVAATRDLIVQATRSF